MDKKIRKHRKTHGKLGFVALLKEIAAQWRILPLKEKHVFINLAKTDMKRYLKEKSRYDGVLNINDNAKDSFKVPSLMDESEHYDGVCGGWISQNNNCIPTVSTVFNMKNSPSLSELWSSQYYQPTPEGLSGQENPETPKDTRETWVCCTIERDCGTVANITTQRERFFQKPCKK